MAKQLNLSHCALSADKLKRVCMLKPMEPEHQTIYLNSGKNIVGRKKETGIRDVRCSKEQLQIDLQLDEYQIILKVLGLNPSAINGVMLMQNSECKLEHGDIIEVVYGRHPFEVVFKPPPETIEVNQSKITQNITKNTMNTVNNSSDENSSDGTWDCAENGKLLIYTSAGVKSSEKIASYDIDGTIITTKSGNVFPKSNDDWQIIFAEVPKRLKTLHENNYKICFFTNQNGISKGKVDVNGFKIKIKSIQKKLGVPVQVFIATDESYYRKPLPGMWEHMQLHKNDAVKLDLRKCFFVGDAAGRPECRVGGKKRKKDHSLVDRFFAANVGVAFYTPEEHFLLKQTEQWTKLSFEPSVVDHKMPLLQPENSKLKLDKTEIIIMVGLPGSGKSYFVQRHLAPCGFTIANADTLGSSQACLKTCEKALNSYTSCVVDNTNVDAASRKKFIDLSKKFSVSCRCFVMNTSIDQVKHNIAFRHLTNTKQSKINDMVFNMMKKKYIIPTLSERFDEIVRVNIIPNFNDAEHERLYKLYLVEK